MAQGYFTVEKWQRGDGDGGEWLPCLELPLGETLTAAEEALAALDAPGLYRIIQMQRVIWAEQVDQKIQLRKSHASSSKSLAAQVTIYEERSGIYPAEAVRATRRRMKNERAKRQDS